MTSAARPRRLALAAVLAVPVLAAGAVAATAATPGPSPTAEQPAEQPAERKAERKAAPVTGPAFVCDPALSHGQNVSAYARSLPEGPGRGRLVSQAARSDCGKPSSDD